jgi:fatty-acyl-CoA synthase
VQIGFKCSPSESDLLTFKEMLNQTAKWYPDHELVAYDENGKLMKKRTYKEFNADCQRVAGAYRSLGLKKGDRVVLLWRGPDLDHTTVYFAATKMGVIPCSLNFRFTAKMLAQQCNLIDPKVLIYDSTLKELADSIMQYKPKGLERWMSSDELMEVASKYPAVEPTEVIKEDDPLAIYFTSGVTGEPKPILHTNRTHWFSAVGQIMTWDYTPETVFIIVLHPSFIGWANFVLGIIRVGGKLIHLRRFIPKQYLGLVEKEKATFLFLVPTMWRMLLREELEKYDLGSVKIAAFAGEPMGPATLEEIKRRTGAKKIIYLYGSTESGSHYGCFFISSTTKPSVEENPLSVGKPLWGVDVRIVKPGGNPEDELPFGEVGEMIIRGPSVAVGVWGDPEKTEKSFKGTGRDKWWFSGDSAYIDEYGCIRILGRTDFTFKSGGMKVHPELVERVLARHPGIANITIIPVEDPIWGNLGKAIVVPKPGVKLDAQELDEWCKKQEDLPSYMRPRHWEFVEEIPMTASGKTDRRKLMELYGKQK